MNVQRMPNVLRPVTTDNSPSESPSLHVHFTETPQTVNIHSVHPQWRLSNLCYTCHERMIIYANVDPNFPYWPSYTTAYSSNLCLAHWFYLTKLCLLKVEMFYTRMKTDKMLLFHCKWHAREREREREREKETDRQTDRQTDREREREREGEREREKNETTIGELGANGPLKPLFLYKKHVTLDRAGQIYMISKYITCLLYAICAKPETPWKEGWLHYIKSYFSWTNYPSTVVIGPLWITY